MAARKDREASALPAWLAERIETFKREPVADPPRSVYRYTYKGKTVYLIPGEGCCDHAGAGWGRPRHGRLADR